MYQLKIKLVRVLAYQNKKSAKTENSEELNYTPQDILLKRDIDYINRVKLKDEYEKRTKTWKDYTREEKANLIMT